MDSVSICPLKVIRSRCCFESVDCSFRRLQTALQKLSLEYIRTSTLTKRHFSYDPYTRVKITRLIKVSSQRAEKSRMVSNVRDNMFKFDHLNSARHRATIFFCVTENRRTQATDIVLFRNIIYVR